MDPAVFDLHSRMEADHWWFRGRRRVISAVIDRIPLGGSDALIVDVGCGTGGTVAHLARSYRCLGVDASEKAIALARSSHPGLQFRCGPVPDAIADVIDNAALILLLDVLEHIEDDRGMLAAIVAATRPGAHILVTVPAESSLWSRHDVTAEHFRRYGRNTFAALWRDLPVTVRLLTHYNTRLYPPIRMVRSFARRLGRASGEHSTDLAMPPRPVNELLAAIFGGEAAGVAGRVDRPEGGGRRIGVSLIALLRRE